MFMWFDFAGFILAQKPHLLLGGWYKPGSGFTRVLLAILPFLQSRFRITWLGVGYQGEAFDLADGVRVLPTNVRGGDLVGAYAARKNWEELSPDAVFVLNDLWYLTPYSREFGRIENRSIPIVGYLPLDGGIDNHSLVRELTGFHELITYTEWAAAQLRPALTAMNISTPVTVAGHGVDLSQFRMKPGGLDLQVRMQRAQDLFRLDEPGFVILNANRPDPRKRLDLTLEAFARFVSGKPRNVWLCLHQAIAHETFVAPLREQARQLGIMDRILWYPPQPGPLSDTALNDLYNACAVGLNTTMGEGFGLIAFEHAATGAPQVMPAQPALAELWQEAALLVSPVQMKHTDYSPLLMCEGDIQAVATALQRLYQEPHTYQHYAEAGRARCHLPEFEWAVPAGHLVRALCRAVGIE